MCKTILNCNSLKINLIKRELFLGLKHLGIVVHKLFRIEATMINIKILMVDVK